MRGAGDDDEARPRHQPRHALQPGLRDEMVMCSPDDERRDGDMRQHVRHLVGVHVPHGARVAPEPGAEVIHQGDADDRGSFEQAGQEEHRHLSQSGGVFPIRRRALQHEASDEVRASQGEFNQDLAAERVTDQRSAFDSRIIHPGGKRVRHAAHGQRPRRTVTAPEAGQVGGEYGKVLRQAACERGHVATGHAEAVHEDHGQTPRRCGLGGNQGVERQSIDAAPAAGEAPMGRLVALPRVSAAPGGEAGGQTTTRFDERSRGTQR